MKRWIQSWRFRKQEERDLSEELRSHMQIEERQRVEAGESPGDAAQAARRVFGNAARIQEDVRETLGLAAIERNFEDVRYGLRMFPKTPAGKSVCYPTLGLCIGFRA